MCSQLKKYKRLIIVSIIVFVIIIGVIYLLNLPPKNKEEKINVAKKLLKMKMTVEQVEEATG